MAQAYIQQLESSRVKLTQLEQEIQKSARAQVSSFLFDELYQAFKYDYY